MNSRLSAIKNRELYVLHVPYGWEKTSSLHFFHPIVSGSEKKMLKQDQLLRKNRQPVKDRCSLVILYTLLLCPTFWVLLHVCWGVEGGGWQWCHVMLTSMKNQNVRWLELSSHIKVINGFKSYSPFINSEVILNEKCFHFLFFSKNMGATISP